MVPGFFEEDSSREDELAQSEKRESDDDGDDDDDDNDDAPSYFYRIEFQARGAPHVHLLAWCKQMDGKPYPNIMDAKKEDISSCLLEIQTAYDKVIKVMTDDDMDPALKLLVERFNNHSKCGFSCHKKKKVLKIGKNEGWGWAQPVPSNAEELAVPICRYGFCRNPSDETIALLGLNEDDPEEDVKRAKKDYLYIRKFLSRMTLVPKGEKREDQPNYKKLIAMSFKDYLKCVGMFDGIKEGSEEEQMVKAKARYHWALRASIRGQMSVFGKRDMKSLFINNFNPKLMTLTKSNHDISYCGDPYSVAQYTTGYVTKAEAGMSALLKRIDEEYKTLPEIEKIKKFAACLDKHRECSIQECVYRLLGLPMAAFSVRVKYINTSHPEKRDGLLRRDLEELDETDSVFYPSPHQYYESRPDRWEEKVNGKIVSIDGKNMCLAHWLSQYDYFASGEPSKNGNGVLFCGRKGWFRRRRQRAVLRYYLRQDDERELSSGICILFLPFRNELNDIHSRDVIQLVAEHADLINDNRSIYERSNLINDFIKKLEQQKEQGQDDDVDTDEEDDDLFETTERYQLEEFQKDHDRAKAISSLPKDLDGISMFDLRGRITSLNLGQRAFFDEMCERCVDVDADKKPSYVYLAGEAGTGKSHLVNTLVPAIKHLAAKSGQDLDKKSVLVLAPSATAAFIVDGLTIESGLGFTMGKYGSYPSGNPDKVSKMAFEYDQLELIVVDEISMVGSNKHAVMNYRLQNFAAGNSRREFMGNFSVLAVGDFRQLPPVKDTYIFENARLDGRPSIAPNLWRDNYEIYYLEQKMRCPDDIGFASLCDRVGKNELLPQDIAYLNSRVVTDEIPEELSNDCFKNGEVTIIVTTNNNRERINLCKLRSLLPSEKEYTCVSDDKNIGRENISLPDSVSQAKNGMVKNLIIRVGAPVMITTNHSVKRYKEDGITNGAVGFIDFIQVSDKDDDLVEIIWVKFKDKRVGKKCYLSENRKHRPRDYEHLIDPEALPIFPSRKTFEIEVGNIQIMRKQFALTLSYAITAHKAQGASLQKVIIDFREYGSKPHIDTASFYTAITRVTRGTNLFLRSFDQSFIRNDKRVEYEINRMRRFKRVAFRKVYLREDIFTQSAMELKIGYLNVNALLAAGSAEYLNGDHNLRHLHLMAIAETHLTRSTSNETLKQVLSNWQILDRFDASDNIAHMGILLLASRIGPEVRIVAKVNLEHNGQNHAQVMTVLISDIKISFVYIRCTPTASDVAWLYLQTSESDFLIGDLNCDPEIPAQKTLLDEIGGLKLRLLVEPTTRSRKQLDHILGVASRNIYFATSYHNFISDHKSVTLRLAPEGTKFVDDDRLTKVVNSISEQSIPSNPGTPRKKNQIRTGQASKKLRS